MTKPDNFTKSKFKYETGLFKKSDQPTDQGKI
jgi:hypothetical protein